MTDQPAPRSRRLYVLWAVALALLLAAGCRKTDKPDLVQEERSLSFLQDCKTVEVVCPRRGRTRLKDQGHIRTIVGFLLAASPWTPESSKWPVAGTLVCYDGSGNRMATMLFGGNGELQVSRVGSRSTFQMKASPFLYKEIQRCLVAATPRRQN